MIVEVLQETLWRRRFIPALHVAYWAVYLMIYGLLCVIPSPTGPAPWGIWLFAWSGCLLPVLLTAGIFGDDIANGRILQLATRPISLGTLYVLRTSGVFLQCALHLAVCYALVFVMYQLTGQQGKGHLALWFLASLLASLTWLTLSASLSALLSREYNIVMIIIGSIVIFMLWQSMTILASMADWPAVSAAANSIVIYGLPPVILLFKLGMQQYGVAASMGVALHAIGMAALYAVIGIVILTHREFVRKRE